MSTKTSNTLRACQGLLLAGVSSILLIDKGFGTSLGVLLVVSAVSIHPKYYRQLTRLDTVFIATLGLYPLLVLLRLTISAAGEIDEFDNPSRFLLIIPIYLWMRVYGTQLNHLILGAMIGCALNAGVFGIEFVAGTNWTRIYGHENSVSFAQIAFLLTALALMPADWLLDASERLKKSYFAAVFAVGLCSVLVTQTRTVVLLTPLLLLSAVFFANTYLWSRKELVLCGVLIFVAGYWVFVGGHFQRLSQLIIEVQELVLDGTTPSYESSQVRLALWRTGWEAFLNNIWFGVGKGEFHNAMTLLHQQNASGSEAVLHYKHAHNELLHLGIELGIPGVVALFMTVLTPVMVAFRYPFCIKSRYLITLLSLSWLAFGTTDVVLENHKILLFILFMLSVGYAEGMNTRSGKLVP